MAPDIRSYNARLVGLVVEKKVNEAVEVFGELGAKNITPDVFTCVPFKLWLVFLFGTTTYPISLGRSMRKIEYRQILPLP